MISTPKEFSFERQNKTKHKRRTNFRQISLDIPLLFMDINFPGYGGGKYKGCLLSGQS